MEGNRAARVQGHRRSISFDRPRNRSNSMLTTRSHTQTGITLDPTTTTSNKVSNLDFAGIASARSYATISHRYFSNEFDDGDSPDNTRPRISAIPPKPVDHMTVNEYESLIERKRQVFSNTGARAQSAGARLAKEMRRKNMLKNTAIFSSQRDNVPEFLTEPKYDTETPKPIASVQFSDLCVSDPKHNSKPSIPSVFYPLPQYKPRSKTSQGRRSSVKPSKTPAFYAQPADSPNRTPRRGQSSSPREVLLSARSSMISHESDVFNDGDSDDEYFIRVESSSVTSSIVMLEEESSSLLESSHLDRGSVMYTGVPDPGNYFGEDARNSFFMLYHRLSKKYDMAGPTGKTTDEDDIDLLNENAKGLLSPRHRFIHLLIEDAKHTPLPIIIRHSHDDTELNLAHKALGDDYIIYLSAVINELPNMTKVNLRDNRLTDRGMGKFIHVLTEQSHIDTVDLSENKLDSKSALALSNYLRSEGCYLKTLRLSKADLDDDEIGLFMDALEINKSITEIDLSHNKLGGPGEKSIHLKGDSLSGGAAIAKALGANRTLLSMNLSWNKLGPASAITLGDAIFTNNTLMSLNLAYNRIKDEGAEAIGAALASNICLTSLDLSYNGIGPMGAMVLAGGLRLAGLIQRINISGNPIGERGGQALLETVNYHAVEREYIFHDCAFDDFSMRRDPNEVNMAYPTGKYTFDLSVPRNKCIVLELLHMATIKRGCVFKNIEYRSTASISGKRRIPGRKYGVTLIRPGNPAPLMGEPYSPWRKQEPRPRHPYTLLEADEWMKIQESLQLLDASTGKPWFVPNIGSLTFEFVYSPRVATPIECLNATGLRRIITILKSHPKEFAKILRMCRHLHMESYQLEEILSAVDNDAHPVDAVELFGNLLGCVRDTSNTYAMLRRHPTVMEHIKDIQLLMRQLFYVSINAFTGHYSLDLSNNIDRVTGVRLMEISAAERSYIKRANTLWQSASHGFTSQKQNRLGFRNERFRRIEMEKGLTEDFFARGLEDKVNGSLEFDFVSSSRPVDGVRSISDSYLTHLLQSHGLLNAAHCPISHIRRRKRSVITKLAAVSAIEFHQHQDPEPTVTKELAENAVQSHKAESVAKLEKSHVTRVQARHSSKPIEGDPHKASVLGHFVVDEKRRLIVPPPYAIDDISACIASFGSQYVEDVKPDDLLTIQQDLSSDIAVYYADQSLDRFCVNVCIRILSGYTENIFEPIAFIRKTNDGKFETFGKEENSSNRGVNLIELLGLEGDNAHYEIGTVNNVNVAGINPSHKRYIINDDIIILGSEIFARLRCSDWNNEKIHDYVREVVSRLFSCIGVHKKCIRIVQHRTADAKQTDFHPPKMQGIVNHVVLQQLDVYVEGIPIDDRMLLKTYAETGRMNSTEDQFNFVNSVWRWRPRQPSDRGSARIDLNTFPYEFWGFKLMQLRTALSSMWITCEQAHKIALEFPQFGYDAQPHRESAITALFSRVIDLENFHKTVAALPCDSYGALYNRVGWLNALNAYEFDFSFDLDLSIEDQRIVTFMLAKFALVEPGDNFIEPRFRRSSTELFIPGWGLPASWTNLDDKKSGDGVPRKGHLVVTYTSSAANGCQVVPRIRKQLQERFLLLSVPQCDVTDLFALDEKPSDWDDMN